MKSHYIHLRNDATTIQLIGTAIVKPVPKHVATLLRYVTWQYRYCLIMYICWIVNTIVYLVLYSYIWLNKHSVLHNTNDETNSTLQAEVLELVVINYNYMGPLAP